MQWLAVVLKISTTYQLQLARETVTITAMSNVVLCQTVQIEKNIQSVEHQVDHRNVKWLTLYFCCLLTEMAEILFPATFFQDVLTFKISALLHIYFQSFNTFC